MSEPVAKLPPYLSVQPDCVTLAAKLQPRASQNEIGDVIGGELKIKVTAPPVDSAANDALIRLLADKLDCPKSRIELVRGKTSRHKTLRIHGIPVLAVIERLR